MLYHFLQILTPLKKIIMKPFITNIWDKVTRSESVLYASFSILSSNLLDADKNGEKPILPGESYFEISLTEQFLKYKREHWKEYIPLTLFLTEFIYAGQKDEFPFVVGPDLLKSIQQMEGNENVRFKNTRVLGPIPYRGDNVVLFVGLMRFKTKNWATQTIKLLESVAKSFDSSKLSGYLNIAEPVMAGIEGFFGMGDDMQFRMGQRNEFQDAEIHDGNVFKSGYSVMIREHQDKAKPEHFWVKNNELYYGKNKDNIQPYRENDYILYEISTSDKRNDYETFEFHKHWEKAREAVINKNRQQAEAEYRNLQVKLLNSKDIIEKQKDQLMSLYLSKFEKLKKNLDKSPDFDSLFESVAADDNFVINQALIENVLDGSD